jgi:hypothetical protein
VTPESDSGSLAGLNPSPSLSFINASISTGKNGADAGIVKTRGLVVMGPHSVIARRARRFGIDGAASDMRCC